MGEADRIQEVDHHPRRWWAAAVLVAIFFLALTRDLWTYTGVARGDVLNFFLPYYMLLADFVRHGQLMLWDPWSSGGVPIFADAQTGALSPLTNLFALITGPTTGGYLLYSLSMWLVGPLGVMVLGRHLKAPAWGCMVAAAGYMACGVYLGQPHHLSHQVSFSFIPWVLWRLDVAILTRRVWPLIESAALLGLSGLSGYPGLTFLTLAYCALWAIGRIASVWREWGVRPLLDFALAAGFSSVVLAVILAPPYLGMLYEGQGYTSRSEALDRDYAISVQPTAPEALLTMGSTSAQLAVNEVLQQRSPYERVLPMRVSVGCGFVTLALAMLAIIAAPRDLFRWVLLLTGILFLALATGRDMPLRGWLYDLVPPVRMIRHAGIFRDYWFISVTCLALLASRDITARTQQQFLMLISAAIGVLSIVTYFLMARFVGPVGGWLAIAQLALPTLLVALLLVRSKPQHVGIYLATIAVVDAALAFELCAGRTFAFRDDNARQVWRQFDDQWVSSLSVSPDRAAIVSSWNEHLVTKRPILASYTPLRNSALPHATDSEAAKQAALQRLAFATGPQRFWWSADPALTPLGAGDSQAMRLHLREVMLGTAAAPANGNGEPMQRVEARVQKYTPTELELSVASPGQGWLLVTDRWSRSWKATVNGTPAQVVGGNDLYRALKVPAGEVVVNFRFDAGWVKRLTALSWCLLVVIPIGSAIVARWNRRRR